MAKQKAQINSVVKCDFCCKEIPAKEGRIPVDYVWYEGRKACMECLAKGAFSKPK